MFQQNIFNYKIPSLIWKKNNLSQDEIIRCLEMWSSSQIW